MGLEFPNPVGLAAGLDKDAAHIDALARMGFGFIEVGTVTPRPQPGNPRAAPVPHRREARRSSTASASTTSASMRSSRTWRARAGAASSASTSARTPTRRSSARSTTTSSCLEKVYARASYVTINISSPNTEGPARPAGKGFAGRPCSGRLASRARAASRRRHGKRVPLVLKIAPDLDTAGIRTIADAVRRHGIDGVIATNTSVSREGVERPAARRRGRRPVGRADPRAVATRVLKELSLAPRRETTLIGAGGILCGADAAEKRSAGAALVQLYTGLIYRGPDLVGECVSAYRAPQRSDT